MEKLSLMAFFYAMYNYGIIVDFLESEQREIYHVWEKRIRIT